MLSLLKLIIIVLTFISISHEAIAADEPLDPYIFLPLNKHIDASKPLYSAEILTEDYNRNAFKVNLLIDIDAPFVYYDCIMKLNYEDMCPSKSRCTYPFKCDDDECIDIRTSYSPKNNPSCHQVTNSSRFPGWEFCTCTINVVNPITRSCSQGLLGWYTFIVPITVCAPSSSFQSFPAKVTGVMALSNSPYSLMGNSYKKIIALCLPSTLSTPGILFHGNTPYNLLPKLKSSFSYTPLIKHPGSLGYYIRVNTIVIKKRSINIPGNTSTKISTLDPYTILRTDIYNRVVRRFLKVTKRIPPTKPVPPFGLCFRTSINGTQVGLRVPDIDFILPEGKKWTMSTANSINKITKDVACLAFVDGGATSQPPIVIGTFQMEDNFVVFDLEQFTFGFTSSLLRKKTFCSNFNYTLVNN